MGRLLLSRLLVVLATALMMTSHVSDAAYTKPDKAFVDCWLLFGSLDDIGYTHSMNLGRLTINRALRAKYMNESSVTFESIAYPGVFFMPAEERQAIVNASIAQGCNVIVASSAGLFDDLQYAREFPNITFIAGSGQQDLSGEHDIPTNLVHYGIDWFSASFVSGVVAASFSQTCGVFITSFMHPQSAWNHAMGFTLGYHWLKPNQQVHVVTMDSYFRPDSEVLAAQQFVASDSVWQCDVLGRHTDPNHVDRYVHSNNPRTSDDRTVLTMARYVDMSTFVGDSVFTSQVWDPAAVFGPMLEETFLRSTRAAGDEDYRLDLSHLTNDFAPMMLSPPTPAVNQSAAAYYKAAAWDFLANNNPLCGTTWRHNGQPTSSLSSSNNQDEECMDFLSLQPRESYLDLDFTSYYDSFVDGGEACGGETGGGQYYTYNATTLQVTCHPCPENTYRMSGERAERTCMPCPQGTQAQPGSLQCTIVVVTNSDSSQREIILGVTLSASFVLLLLVVAFYIVLKRQQHYQDDDVAVFAPKNPHESSIAVMFTDIEAATTLWANAPQEMARAVEIYHALLLQILRQHEGYKVKRIGDSYMIVHTDISKAVLIALDLQRMLHMTDWGTHKLDGIYKKLAEAAKSENIVATSSTEHQATTTSTTTTSTTVDDGIDSDFGETTRRTDGAPVKDDDEESNSSYSPGRVWNGLRVRVGIAYGQCQGKKNSTTGGWEYSGDVVDKAARVEAAGYGGQVLLTRQAFSALLGLTAQSSATLAKSTMGSAHDPMPLSEVLKKELCIDSVHSHGDVFLRGLKDRVELYELTPVGLSARRFPPLRVGDIEMESGAGSVSSDDESLNFASLHNNNGGLQRGLSDESTKLWNKDHGRLTRNTSDGSNAPPGRELERLAKIAMREIGIRRYDRVLWQSVMNTFCSIQAMFSLHLSEERQAIYENLLQRWHLQVPQISNYEIPEHDAGGHVENARREQLMLLVLAIRAATIAYVDTRESFVNFQSNFWIGSDKERRRVW